MMQVSIIGRLGSDPEERSLPNGDPVTSFSVASTHKRGTTEETTWLKIVAFGHLAGIINRCRKGEQHFFQGRLRCRKWESQDGRKGEAWECILSQFNFLQNERRPDDDYQAGSNQAPPPADDFDDDIPF